MRLTDYDIVEPEMGEVIKRKLTTKVERGEWGGGAVEGACHMVLWACRAFTPGSPPAVLQAEAHTPLLPHLPCHCCRSTVGAMASTA